MNSFGEIFRLTTFGESHGVALGGVLDGCPAGIRLDVDFIRQELHRRSTGQHEYASQRQEADDIEWLSGLFEGRTTGAPIGFIIRNTDARTEDYETLKHVIRPGHADATYEAKYGIRDYRGGGRSSARETVIRVVAGAIAKLYLKEVYPNLRIEASAEIDEAKIEQARQEQDSVGGCVSCVISGLPAGLGEPVYDKLPARLAYAMLSINACRGFEIGKGFEAAKMRGTVHNQYHDGTLGGISTGEDICLRLAFKPTPSVGLPGRHDVCFVPRVPVIVEAMAALVLADMTIIGSGDRVRASHN